jgi:hypothetical protein
LFVTKGRRRFQVMSGAIEWFVGSGVVPLGGGLFREVPCLISRDGVHVVALNGRTVEQAKRLYLEECGEGEGPSPIC